MIVKRAGMVEMCMKTATITWVIEENSKQEFIQKVVNGGIFFHKKDMVISNQNLMISCKENQSFIFGNLVIYENHTLCTTEILNDRKMRPL